MFDRWTIQDSLVLITAMWMLGLLGVGDALAITGCQEPLPSPCAADGICRPTVDWGYSRTRWRRWPSDPGYRATTIDDGPDSDPERQELDVLELPTPRQEDLRGPVKRGKPKAETNAEGDESSQPLPGADVLRELNDEDFPGIELEGPGLDPQGNRQRWPSKEDGPPRLPASLREIGRRQLHRPPNNLTVAAPQPKVVSATLDNRTSIRLINPAATRTSGNRGELWQAIYHEAAPKERPSPERPRTAAR